MVLSSQFSDWVNVFEAGSGTIAENHDFYDKGHNCRRRIMISQNKSCLSNSDGFIMHDMCLGTLLHVY